MSSGSVVCMPVMRMPSLERLTEPKRQVGSVVLKLDTWVPRELLGSYTGPGLPMTGEDLECSLEIKICTQ